MNTRILPHSGDYNDHRSFQDGRDSGCHNLNNKDMFSGGERGYRMESTRRRGDLELHSRRCL
jgi:hypothetical protein